MLLLRHSLNGSFFGKLSEHKLHTRNNKLKTPIKSANIEKTQHNNNNGDGTTVEIVAKETTQQKTITNWRWRQKTLEEKQQQNTTNAKVQHTDNNNGDGAVGKV